MKRAGYGIEERISVSCITVEHEVDIVHEEVYEREVEANVSSIQEELVREVIELQKDVKIFEEYYQQLEIFINRKKVGGMKIKTGKYIIDRKQMLMFGPYVQNNSIAYAILGIKLFVKYNKKAHNDLESNGLNCIL